MARLSKYDTSPFPKIIEIELTRDKRVIPRRYDSASKYTLNKIKNWAISFIHQNIQDSMKKRSHRTNYNQEKLSYVVRLEKSLMVTLGVLVFLFLLFRQLPEKPSKIYRMTNSTLYTFEIPMTRQGSLPRPPDLPKVPIPVEDEYIPEDETIPITEIDLMEDIPLFDGMGGFDGRVWLGTPRPIHNVIPEYPNHNVEGVVELEIFINTKGCVDSVLVVYNSTHSKKFEKAAIDAAYGSRFMPVKRDGKPVGVWVRRPYRFEKK